MKIASLESSRMLSERSVVKFGGHVGKTEVEVGKKRLDVGKIAIHVGIPFIKTLNSPTRYRLVGVSVRDKQ